ncbi:MAG: helix-turn-helix transcriptional regulator [Oscillospiraceae bacterium]|nr:helix-turn-helix transcriptional regulator [Oscillospiraceae bacterium]
MNGQHIVYLLTKQAKWAKILSMNNMDFKTPSDLGLIIAMNARAYRKTRKLSLKRLSEMSGVSYGSMKRFELSGEISLKSLLKIAIVLDCADAFETLFANVKPQSIQEIIDGKL